MLTKHCCYSVSKLCLTLQPHGLQNTRALCPPLSPGVCAKSCALNLWCYRIISSSPSPFSFFLPFSPPLRIFSDELTLLITCPKYGRFSFSIRPSNEYSGLISFRIDQLTFFKSDQTFSSVQFSSVAQSCLTLCDPMNRSTPGLLVHHQLPEFIQTHVHRVGDAIQPSHPLSSPSPPAPNPSQHQGLFQWVSSSNQMAKVLKFQLQHQSFQWTPRTDLR